jgi:hypothetical protein
MTDESRRPLPWLLEEVEEAQRTAVAAGWSEPEIRSFLNSLAELPGPRIDLVSAIGLATGTRATPRTRARFKSR